MMNSRKKGIRLSLAMIAAILIGWGAVVVISRGFEYVVAADIHPTITEPLEDKDAVPGTPNRYASAAKSASPAKSTPRSPSGAVLGEYTTKFGSKAKARNENISHAANSIKGTVIEPGEVFSYNKTIGPTTKENGYKMARIFVRGKKALGYGGGVCQVSSTLYNAAESAGMEIVERHSHSLPVEYVPKGKDAATSYGSVDLKFKNTSPNPVKIDTAVTENSVTVKILSS